MNEVTDKYKNYRQYATKETLNILDSELLVIRQENLAKAKEAHFDLVDNQQYRDALIVMPKNSNYSQIQNKVLAFKEETTELLVRYLDRATLNHYDASKSFQENLNAAQDYCNQKQAALERRLKHT